MGALNPDSKLCVLHCSKAYSGQPSLQDISFTVRDGEFVAILGPSGCGKTTLLRILTGLVSPDSGTILKDGQDITHLPPDQRKIGIVFQNYALFENMTVLKNVAYALRFHAAFRGKEAAMAKDILRISPPGRARGCAEPGADFACQRMRLGYGPHHRPAGRGRCQLQ